MFKRARTLVVAGSVFTGSLMAALFVALPSMADSPGAVGSWTTNTNALPQVLQSAASVTNKGSLYVIGGQNGSGTPQSTVYYTTLNSDGSTGTWTTNTHPLPQTVTLETAVVYNGYVYVMGGYNGSSNVSTVYYAPINADGSIGTWTTSTHTLPQGLSNATSVVYNGYVYVMDGTNGSSYLNTVYYAKLNTDGSIGTWSTNTNPVPAAMVLPSSFVHNGYAYIVGGYLSGSISSASIYYAPINTDGSIGTWTTNSTSLTQGVYGAGTAVYNGYVFEFGGYHNLSIINNVYSAPINADNSIGTWTASSNNLPTPLTYMASATYNGYAYILGGGYAGTSSAVYYAPLSGYAVPGVVTKGASVVANGSVTVDVLTGISGNPNPSTLHVISGPSHGTAIDPPSTITYTPNAGYTGTDSLVYQVCSLNDSSVCAQATLNFTVTANVVSSTSTTSSGTTATKAPDTGYGTPTNSVRMVSLAVLVAGVTSLSAGFYLYRRSTVSRS